MNELDKLSELLRSKASVKQDVFQHGKKAFSELKENAKTFIHDLSKPYQKVDPRVKIKIEDVSDQEFRLIVGGDVLLFHMHTNVFQYDKSHYYWQQSYFKDDSTRSYGIIIQVYNFLTDSLVHKRENDLGYLIGRIFINRENNFILESRSKLSTRFPYLNSQKFTKEEQKKIIGCLLIYSMEFELNIPPFSNVQTLSVKQAQDFKSRINIMTAKRLGFRFSGVISKENE